MRKCQNCALRAIIYCYLLLKSYIKVRDNRREKNKIKTHLNGIKDKANTIIFRLFKVIKENRGMNKF